MLSEAQQCLRKIPNKQHSELLEQAAQPLNTEWLVSEHPATAKH